MESLILLPLLITVFLGLSAAIYQAMGYFLVDHWTHNMSLCIAKEKSIAECKAQFKNQTNSLPFLSIKDILIRKNSKEIQSQVRVVIHPLEPRKFKSLLIGPLNAQHFKEAQ